MQCTDVFGNELSFAPSDRVSLWAGPVERFVPNSVGGKNEVEEEWRRRVLARFYATLGPYYCRVS